MVIYKTSIVTHFRALIFLNIKHVSAARGYNDVSVRNIYTENYGYINRNSY